MKKSGFRAIFHIYIIFACIFLGLALLALGLALSLVTMRTSQGTMIKSDWPKKYTEAFSEQIIFGENAVRVRQSGVDLLQRDGVGLQILDSDNQEVYRLFIPDDISKTYTTSEVLNIYATGHGRIEGKTAMVGSARHAGREVQYILYFPMDIAKITMYLNGASFKQGKSVVLIFGGAIFLLIVVLGIGYGLIITKQLANVNASIHDIVLRRFIPEHRHGVFEDVYHALDHLDTELRKSDELQAQTNRMREEWIANITHDLKTPLSPIKGYAEMIGDDAREISPADVRRYGQVMLKNADYMERLLDDLKLTYQLKSGVFPCKLQQADLIRFLKELVIDILNRPEYEERTIHFENDVQDILFSFDPTLLTRAFNNLILNSFVHGKRDTQVWIRIAARQETIKIQISDNGNGMTNSETKQLFERYYRGMDTESRPEGTGLGLAIAKQIIELHGGQISVSSYIGKGTCFEIEFGN